MAVSKEIDPCEKGMECNQDREIRKPEEEEKEIEEKELNWKHEELVPEAPDPIPNPIPDTNSIPRIPHDQTKFKEEEHMNKVKAQKGENEKEEVKELQTQLEQLKLLEAQGEIYDPEKMLSQSIKDKKEMLKQGIQTPGTNPVNIVRMVQLLKDIENEEKPVWQIKQQQRIKNILENHRVVR